MADKTTPEHVLVYIPNLIGYARVVLALYSFWVALSDYKTSVLCYFLSFACDYFDGFFARLFHQTSSFGAVLDMVTDRCATAGLLLILSNLYPQYMHLFLFALMLDFSSHWIHMYSSRGHHKTVDEDRNWLLKTYYATYPLFAYCCVGAELTYITMYVLHFDPDLAIPFTSFPLATFCYYVCLPACVLKNIVNVAQLCSASYSIAQRDAEEKNK